MVFEGGGGKTDRAGVEGIPEDRRHPRAFFFGRRAFRGRVAEHCDTDAGVTGEGGDVRHHPAARQQIEIIAEIVKPPIDSRAQGGQRHAFDLGQVLDQDIPRVGRVRRDPEAAIADHHGRDSEGRRG